MEPSFDPAESTNICIFPFATVDTIPAIDAVLISDAIDAIVVPESVTVTSFNIILCPFVNTGLVAVPIIVGHEFFHASLPTNTQLFAVTLAAVFPGDL